MRATTTTEQRLGWLDREMERLGRQIEALGLERTRLLLQRGAATDGAMAGELIEAAARVKVAVEREFGLPPGALDQRCRRQPVALGRQVAMWLLHTAGCGFSRVGRLLGRDHGTVFFAVRAVENQRAVSAPFRARCERLRTELAETLAGFGG